MSTAYELGVKTYVMGLPGSEEALAALSRAAYSGGTAPVNCSPNSSSGPYCHMDLTTAPDMSEALRAGLGQVIGALPGCRVDIPTSLGDTAQATDVSRLAPLIRFSNGTNVLLGRVTAFEPGCSEGYRVISSSQIELCADTCAGLHADSTASMRLIFGCSADEIHTALVN